MAATNPNLYQSIGDLAELTVVLRELRRAAQVIGQFADVAFEDVDVQAEWAVGMRMAGSLLRDTLISAAEVRLLTLMTSPCDPSVADSKGTSR